MKRTGMRTSSGLILMGQWDVEIDRRKTGRFGGGIQRFRYRNIIVDEALAYVLDVALQGGTQIPTWYMAPYKNNYTPISTNVGTSFPTAGVANEMTDYDEATRGAFVPTLVLTPPLNVNNIASRAEFTFNNVVAQDLYGAFMISTSAKGDLTGTLFAAKKFPTVKNVIDDEILRVGYTIYAQSV